MNEPIPIRRQPEQNRGAAERGGECRRPAGEHIIRLPNNMDILRRPEERRRLDGDSQRVTVFLAGGAVEVKEVLVPGVVDGVEEAKDPARIVGGSGYEVS